MLKSKTANLIVSVFVSSLTFVTSVNAGPLLTPVDTAYEIVTEIPGPYYLACDIDNPTREHFSLQDSAAVSVETDGSFRVVVPFDRSAGRCLIAAANGVDFRILADFSPKEFNLPSQCEKECLEGDRFADPPPIPVKCACRLGIPVDGSSTIFGSEMCIPAHTCVPKDLYPPLPSGEPKPISVSESLIRCKWEGSRCVAETVPLKEDVTLKVMGQCIQIVSGMGNTDDKKRKCKSEKALITTDNKDDMLPQVNADECTTLNNHPLANNQSNCEKINSTVPNFTNSSDLNFPFPSGSIVRKRFARQFDCQWSNDGSPGHCLDGCDAASDPRCEGKCFAVTTTGAVGMSGDIPPNQKLPICRTIVAASGVKKVVCQFTKNFYCTSGRNTEARGVCKMSPVNN